MRSPRPERSHALAALAITLACGAVGGACAADAAPAVASAASALTPTQREERIAAVVRQLRADPLISGRHTEHELQWKKDEEKKPGKTLEPESGSHWFRSFLDFLNDTSRFLLWGGALVLVAVLLVSGRHLIQLQALRRRGALPTAVSHVRDLDVRPESLPDDVGAAAWTLWQAGQVRAALSLLYRGALSRLIHRHQVPITASATEGECLELARTRLDAGALRYVTQVVRAWEAGIYGGRTLSSTMGETLCADFATRLDATPAVEDAA